MLKNYFLIAWRSLVKNSTFYFVNIFGLSVGLACCLLISSYVYSELTYDQYPEHSKDIYRVELRVLGNGSWAEYPNIDYGVGSGIAQTYPEVTSFTRVSRGFSWYLKYKETVLKEQSIALVDSNFLQFFSIPLIAGSDKTALSEPNSIVISKAFAKKYFGDEDPMGKSLSISNGNELKVTGMIDQVPAQTHFQFDAFLSGATFKNRRESWSNLGNFTYLQLVPGADAKALEKKFPDLVMKHVVPEVQADMGASLEEAQKAVGTFIFTIRPLQDIHLGSHTSMELGANGDIKYVYIFGALAVFILLLACVNFINLSTATSSKRAREVGIRKVMGSIKSQLIWQFLTESVMLALCALVLSYGIVAGVLPLFNQLTGKVIEFSFFVEPVTVLIITAGVVLVGMIAGLYPSFFLSSFNTISVLKGSISRVGKKDFLRSGLVVFQFAVSTALLVATLVVYQQLNFMQNKKLGYDKDQVLIIHDTRSLKTNEQVFKEQLLKDSRVLNASISRQMPGDPNMDGTQAFPKDRAEDEGSSEIHINIYHVDYDFLSTLNMELAYGRNLSRDFPSDSAAIVINEAGAKEFGWSPESCIGKSIVMSGQREYHVVGVVKDFNYTSVRDEIAPLVMVLQYNSGSILVKLNPTDIKSFIADAKSKWATFNTDIPFTYSFLDEKFAALYHSEERTGKVFTTFAIVALLIAGLGLFGLSTFSAEQRTREIGIRKVLGASSRQVLVMLSKQFMVLVLIAFVIATPIIAWAMNHWLEEFAYRISIAWWVFAAAAGISFMIAFLSMCIQAVRAAIANPVRSLKSE